MSTLHSRITGSGPRAVVLLGALGACTPDKPEPGTRLGCSALRPGADGYAVSGYELREVRPDPYARVSANLVNLAEGRTDAAGAFVPELPNDLGPGYHPVGMAQHALWSLGSYRATDDPAYLARTVATAGALLDVARSAIAWAMTSSADSRASTASPYRAVRASISFLCAADRTVSD